MNDLGEKLFTWRLAVRKTLLTVIMKNYRTMIGSIVIICLPLILLIFTQAGFTFAWSMVYTFVGTILLAGYLFWEGARYNSKVRMQNFLDSTFTFNRSNINGIDLSDIGFEEKNRDNFNLILNNITPKIPLDFKLISDNRQAADYKKLFRILHLLIDGGIKSLSTERKDLLYNFIESHFSLNGAPIKKASFNTRYSEWINEKDNEFETNLKPFSKALHY